MRWRRITTIALSAKVLSLVKKLHWFLFLCQTCTAETVSRVASVASAREAADIVQTVCVDATASVIHDTFVNIYRKTGLQYITTYYSCIRFSAKGTKAVKGKTVAFQARPVLLELNSLS